MSNRVANVLDPYDFFVDILSPLQEWEDVKQRGREDRDGENTEPSATVQLK